MKEGGQHLWFVWTTSGDLGLGCMALVEEAGLGAGRATSSGIKPRGQVQRCSKEGVRATGESPDQRLLLY